MLQVKDGDGSQGDMTTLAVEIPLIVLALATVVVRLYSRLAVKRKLAADDVLIVCGLVSVPIYKLFDAVRRYRVFGGENRERHRANSPRVAHLLGQSYRV
jgi:hypothetical protein